ncbi:MAG TPA: hypothetical protein VGC96_09265 [Candidatus Elarobacter sp.]
MGLQIVHDIALYWPAAAGAVAVILAAVLADALTRAGRSDEPADLVSNGITVGRAKAFDNRSLALRIQRLSAGLEALKVITQDPGRSVGSLQGQTSSTSATSLKVGIKKAIIPGTSDKAAGNGDKGVVRAPEAASGSDDKPVLALAAGDVLNDQLNLASQIVNLELLYERSLTDRLLSSHARLQTVLGFQVSITPPAGTENSVAIVEISVRMVGSAEPVSLVALIPQEKTYNAQSISSSARSIEGSAVADVITVGLTNKGESRQLFIHRDSDTIAFERDPDQTRGLFADDPKGIVFGWEFRPVLGRTTVTAGTRQMLAVVALPVVEQRLPGEVTLEVVTRSYWRRYARKRQTSRPSRALLSWGVDRSGTKQVGPYPLAVPNIARIQAALAPRVDEVTWVNGGTAYATVIVKGVNLFSGTRVVFGGTVHSEDDGLTLKSDQALEFSTSLATLATGGAVVSGRFGPSIQLEVPASARPVKGVRIDSATVRPIRFAKTFLVRVDITALENRDFTMEQLARLPDPILFVGSEPVAMPYDYETVDIEMPTGATRKGVRVEAQVPAALVAAGSSITFRVPFCGVDFESSQPFSFAEPMVTRIGGDETTSVYRFTQTVPFLSDVSVDLDRTYPASAKELIRNGDYDIRFTIPTAVVERYRNAVLRNGAYAYLLTLPVDDGERVSPRINDTARVARIVKGTFGPVELAGENLDLVDRVTFFPPLPAQNGATRSATGSPADFAVSDGGKRIELYLKGGSTEETGKAEIELRTTGGDVCRAPLFVTNATPS